jgi:hypothetical protein
MDPGYRSPLIEFFRRGDAAHDVKVLAARGELSSAAHEQVALLVLLSDDPDRQISAAVATSLKSIPTDALRAFLARADVPAEMKTFFAARGIAPAEVPAADASEPLVPEADDDDDEDREDDEKVAEQGNHAAHDDEPPKILAGLPVKKKMKLAFKGTREQRSQLIRDPNKIVAAAVLSSPKLTEAEVEAFAKMANVSEEVLRVIAMNRTWLKHYGVVIGLVKNPKTPMAISMQLLPRVSERDMKMLTVDRNVPEALRLAARKFVAKALK